MFYVKLTLTASFVVAMTVFLGGCLMPAHHSPAYVQPAQQHGHAQPVYQQNGHAQPVYQQHGYAQPTHGQTVYVQH